MDEVADACMRGLERPAFYVSEEGQQHQFTCSACGEFNDIIGRFGYCSSCGTRCDLLEFELKEIADLRARLASGAAPENCLRDAVSAFDSVVSQYAKQLAATVPMTKGRKNRLTKQRFHDLEEVQTTFLHWFDIDLFRNIKDDVQTALKIAFLRRHLHEHNGGEVDQKFLDKSKSTEFRLKQVLREAPAEIEKILTPLVLVVRNLHNGFHELIPPFSGPIEEHEKSKARARAWKGQH
ncbi:hypothetical protein [Variovorax sp. V15]|uniref:hypothetical protein n=1 Tax=Variovorax sp. V15 TaxID=3065952 RepID=UPI0034E8E9DF